MIKIYIDVKSEHPNLLKHDRTPEEIEELFTRSEVVTDDYFCKDDYSLFILDTAKHLASELEMNGIQCRVGVAYDYHYNYPGWTLFVEVDYVKGSINPVVSKFFRWKRIETQSILSFGELLETYKLN